MPGIRGVEPRVTRQPPERALGGSSNDSYTPEVPILQPARPERAPVLYRALHTTLRPAINAVFRPWAEGLAHIPRVGPAILASNHLSFLDHFFLPAAIDRPIFFLGKSDYFKGWRRFFYENVGVMPVDRSGGEAGEASLRKGQAIPSLGGCSASIPRAPVPLTGGSTVGRPARSGSPCALAHRWSPWR